jgi:hypothetical protein
MMGSSPTPSGNVKIQHTCSFFFFLYTRDVSVSDNADEPLDNVGTTFFPFDPTTPEEDEEDEEEEEEEEEDWREAMRRGEEEVRFRLLLGVC